MLICLMIPESTSYDSWLSIVEDVVTCFEPYNHLESFSKEKQAMKVTTPGTDIFTEDEALCG